MSDEAQFEREMATAAHNLREPLRMIRCYVDLMAEQPEEAALCRERISAGAERLERLIGGMFECLQLRASFAPERADLNRAYATALSRLPPEERAGIEAGDLPTVAGDFEMLTEVLSRLIDNARKYRGERPLTVRLSATLDAAAGQWRVSVADHGRGIEPGQRERCFEMFQRLHGNEIPGEGFGLAYCRRAIELHGGSIRLEATSGGGTTVAIALPAA